MGNSWDFSNRYKNSDKAKSENNRPNIFDFGDKTPKFFKPKFVKENDTNYNRIDIVPYQIKTKKHPLIANKASGWEIGNFDYVLDVWVHKYIGPQKASVVCLHKTYGKDCPICQEAGKAYEAGNKDLYGSLKAKRRVFYNVICRTKGEDDDSIQIFDTSYEWFESRLRKAAKSEAEDAGLEMIDYAHPVNGKTIRFDAVDSGLNAKTPALEFSSFKFSDRDSIEKRVKDSISLDEAMIVLSYEEIQKILFADETDDDEEEAPRKPVREEEEPAPKKEESKGSCPSGHKFGVDTDEFPECDKCPKETWKACEKASKADTF